MFKFLVPTALALGLTACTAPDNGEDRERQIQLWVGFIQSEVDLLIDIYGDDWFTDLDNEEKLFILTGCNVLTTFTIGSNEFPAEVPETIIETCQLIRDPNSNV